MSDVLHVSQRIALRQRNLHRELPQEVFHALWQQLVVARRVPGGWSIVPWRRLLMFNGRQLGLALVVGLVAQAVLLALGLHASLLFASFSSGYLYWILNGIYFVVAIAICLAAFRWSNLRVRLPVALLVLTLGVAIGWMTAPKPPL